MKTKIKKLNVGLILVLLTLSIGCTTKPDIIINDFESQDFNGWTVEGEAFGYSPANATLPNQNEVSGFEGKGYLNSFHGGDDSYGSLTSKEFVIERDYINFLLGGGTRQGIFIQLLIDGQNILVSRPINESESLQWMTWDVREYKAKKAQIKIVDNQKGGWGHILVDNIILSNNMKSNIVLNKRISFNGKMKYLLLPVCNDVPEVQVSVEVDGNIGNPPYNIRLAKSEIDYWVPIDIEKYKGKKVSLIINHAEEKDIALTQIKQSDDFDFNYNEKYRQVYHFTPQYGWMNDPNGMVYLDGEYHLFFQHNPYGSMWGNMHWGHAVSKDLKKWEYFSDAIVPDSLGAIFSGSAVIDKNNTAGFGENAMIAIYTSASGEQTQSIAYSTDKGRTFTTYDKNPVIPNPGIPDFRDPKVFWHEASQKWIMSLATSQTITFYASKDLKEWEMLSEFGEGIGNHDGVWECPDLFPLSFEGKIKWILLVSINPGGPNGGSATQYFIGDFDGKTFKADSLPYPLWLDYGRDNYAGVTWNNVPQTDRRIIFIGWMNNWNYADKTPTVHFRSSTTVPRELKLSHNKDHLILTAYPVKEMFDLRSDMAEVEEVRLDDKNKIFAVDKLFRNCKDSYEIEMTLQPDNASEFGFKLKNRYNEELVFMFDAKQEILTVDRLKSGKVDFSDKFADNKIVAPISNKKRYKIRLLIDAASSELFVDEGEVVLTNIIYPSEPYNTLEFNTNEGSVNISGIKVYCLK